LLIAIILIAIQPLADYPTIRIESWPSRSASLNARKPVSRQLQWLTQSQEQSFSQGNFDFFVAELIAEKIRVLPSIA
jgi:hypothetical protein